MMDIMDMDRLRPRLHHRAHQDILMDLRLLDLPINRLHLLDNLLDNLLDLPVNRHLDLALLET